jgi:prephenate dehydrogenase
MSPEDHDRTVALTSHVPQVISTALALTLARQQNEQLAKVFGPGLLDMTRLALSDVALWDGILASNEANVCAALDLFLLSLSQLRDSIGHPELRELFQSASNFSSELRKIPCSP